ncbi:hypothetical protein CDV31_013000 [Fusarium ambrosium]|uniref:Uncharacterized protein n=1 Tax=Fusarium ambrosium TaxID=131363 RepID=A0A428T628_9HYPO|nr:hypothetical protein CDV31_013000 [Fusarium ambrosium]
MTTDPVSILLLSRSWNRLSCVSLYRRYFSRRHHHWKSSALVPGLSFYDWILATFRLSNSVNSMSEHLSANNTPIPPTFGTEKFNPWILRWSSCVRSFRDAAGNVKAAKK